MDEAGTHISGALGSGLPDASAAEVLQDLWWGRAPAGGPERPLVRVERIVSRGQASPPGFWYDQAHLEIVVVIAGRARLAFEHAPREVPLGPGDYAVIPAGCRHRVEWTGPGEATIWFAVHIGEPDRPPQ